MARTLLFLALSSFLISGVQGMLWPSDLSKFLRRSWSCPSRRGTAPALRGTTMPTSAAVPRCPFGTIWPAVQEHVGFEVVPSIEHTIVRNEGKEKVISFALKGETLQALEAAMFRGEGDTPSLEALRAGKSIEPAEWVADLGPDTNCWCLNR